MSYIKFESSRVKEAERKGIREARENVLNKAKKDYERRKELEIQAKLRGDDRWMLPSVEARLGDESGRTKHKKKSKHKKKKKKSKKHSSSSSSDSDSDGEEEWVEKGSSNKGEKRSKSPAPKQKLEPDVNVERDEWMNLPGLIPCVSRQELKQNKMGKDQKTEDEKNILDKMGQSERELNPYWKDGGSGLPENKPSQTLGRGLGGVGDKGADWLKRALRRAHEQAGEEGRSVEEVAAERWGSLDKLNSMIEEAEGRLRGRHCGQGDQKWDGKREGSYSRREKYEWRGRNEPRKDSGGDRGWGRSDRESYHGRREPLPPSSLSRGKFKKPSDFDERGSSSHGFRKPADDDDSFHNSRYSGSSRSGSTSGNWRKKDSMKETEMSRGRERVEVERKKERLEVLSSGSSSEEERKERGKEGEEEEKGKILTDQEMNELGAKLVKAEIMGNETLARELKTKLEIARMCRKKLSASVRDGPEKGDEGTKDEEEEVVVLTRTSKQGFSRPVLPSEERSSAGGKKRREKVETHADGKRVRYFADDDKYSLKEMFEREKMNTAQDSNEMFSKLAAKGVGKPDSVNDMDDIFEENARFTKSAQKLEVLDRSRAIAEHKKADKALENCQWCFDSKLMLKHLIIAIGTKACLCLPPHQSLTEGHCMIVPMYHTSCATMADEDVWNEIQEFRKSLTKMFLEMDQDCVFFETAVNLKRFPHMVLECVPMEKETGDLAPIYFKKAIQECEMEWSNNKKVVDLGPKDVRKAIPKGLPYFSVDFGLQNGFAHVIEDERQWPSNFAQEIIGGMLDLDHQLWRKRRKENFDSQRKKVLQFAKWWKPHDWTQKLKGTKKSDSESD